MDYDRIVRRNIFVIVSFVTASVFTLITAFRFSKTLAVAEVICLALIFISISVYSYISKKNAAGFFAELAKSYDFGTENSFNGFPLPILVASDSGMIKWYNKLFLNEFVSGGLTDNSVFQFIDENDYKAVSAENSIDVIYNSKGYSVYSNTLTYKEKLYKVMYFVENTELKKISDEYVRSRPNVILISLDGIEEIRQSFKESECAEIRSAIEGIMEAWCSAYPCILRKIESDRYIIISEKRSLDKMLEERFRVLDTVRAYTYKGSEALGLTLSIGVGQGKDFTECESNSRQALDMALGRGGDQAAVKNRDMSYAFFGGVSKGVEKRAKVKVRIIASAIAELFHTSDDIVVMGHRFSDLDSLGAAVGLCAAAKAFKKPVHIAIDRKKSLAGPLINRMKREGISDLLVEPEEALKKLNENTLLIIVDTHIADFLEYTPLYTAAKKVVVIDHHRKAVNYINNAVIFHHDPTASSASEMVTELLQYMTSSPVIGRFEADALLSGIMLDTRNFVLRTGVRTFEAAAYLRNRGADTVKVKQLFASDMESNRLRNAVINNSVTFYNCAISVADFKSDNIRVICAQAADDLLNIDGVDASFVLFEGKEQINISARSFGAVNVQLVMESLGGGGHQTMAAAQLNLSEYSIDTAVVKLREAINEYYVNLNKTIRTK